MDAHNQEIKKDAGKIRLDLVPVECIEALGKVLTMGAEKYHDNSWREGMNYSRIYAATQRHLQAFWGEGQDIDDESGLPHLYHALCNIAFLITYEDNKERYRTFDDRAGSNNKYYEEQEEKIFRLANLVHNNKDFFAGELTDDCLETVYNTLDYAIHNTDDGIADEPDFPDLTKMTHSEAYKHLEVGMRVKVLRKAGRGERGWPVEWVNPMDKYVGGEFFIERLCKNVGVVLRYEKDGSTWNFPAHVLEIVSNPKSEKRPEFPDLTKMTHPEVCEHLEIGMRVKVLCRGPGYCRGWKNGWNIEHMNRYIDHEFIIRGTSDEGVSFDTGSNNIGWLFPAFVLEIVSRPGDTK